MKKSLDFIGKRTVANHVLTKATKDQWDSSDFVEGDDDMNRSCGVARFSEVSFALEGQEILEHIDDCGGYLVVALLLLFILTQ